MDVEGVEAAARNGAQQKAAARKKLQNRGCEEKKKSWCGSNADAFATATITARRRKMGAATSMPLEEGHDRDDGRK